MKMIAKNCLRYFVFVVVFIVVSLCVMTTGHVVGLIMAVISVFLCLTLLQLEVDDEENLEEG